MSLSELYEVSNFSWICQLSYEVLFVELGWNYEHPETAISQRVILTPPPRILNWPKSPHRLGLTAATCGLNSDVSLKDAVVYHDKENYDIEKYTVHQKFDKGAIFPDLAVLSLRTDIESKKLIAIRRIYEFHPQDKMGMNLNLKLWYMFSHISSLHLHYR